MKMAVRLCLKGALYQGYSHRILKFHPVRTMFFLRDKKAGIDKNPLTDVQVSSEEFKYVEKLLPCLTVPEPPKHEKYPTPSGWIPPSVKGLQHSYFVERTRFHNLPVYLLETDGGTRKITVICRVKGSHWTFEADLRDFLSKRIAKKIYTQVDEVSERVRVRGIYVDEVTEFLLDKGF